MIWKWVRERAEKIKGNNAEFEEKSKNEFRHNDAGVHLIGANELIPIQWVRKISIFK